MNDANFANYTDGGTIFDNVIMSLQESAKRIFQWFSEDQVKGNTNKCYLIMSTGELLQILTGNSSIKRGSCEKFFGVKIDAKLHFDDYAETIHSKASNMLRTSARATAYPAGNYIFKVNNRNTRKRCEICSKLTINTPERRHRRRSGVFIVNFEHISRLVLVFHC